MTPELAGMRLQGLDLKQVQSHTAIPYNALYRLRGGIGRPPSKATLRKLSDFYLKLEAGEIKL